MKMPPREHGRPSSRKGLLFYVRVAGLVALCLVVVLSVIPGKLPIRVSAPRGFDHFIAYFIVASALALGLRRRAFAPAVGIFLISVAGALELIQKLVPGRTAKLIDWGASTMGVIVGIVVAMLLGLLVAAKKEKTISAQDQTQRPALDPAATLDTGSNLPRTPIR